MGVDTVQPTFGIQAVHPKQDAKKDANGQSSHDPRRDGKPGQSDKQPQEQPNVFMNALGEVTGKTINITA
jgi:hypothetical protein